MHRSILPAVLVGVSLLSSGACRSQPPAPADGFLITQDVEIGASPHVVYAAFGKIDQWWDDQHTWSGAARHLSLALEAGGCMCERWGTSSVEHARVVTAQPGQLLRLHGALGPLQEMAVFGSLSFTFKAEGTGTVLTMGYRVSGDSQHGLDRLRGVVASVLEAQLERLKKYVETDSPK